jgi:hypothetical protein
VATNDAQVVIQHRVFVQNDGSTGRHGSASEGTLSAPISRHIYQVYPARWQRATPDPINVEDNERTITNMLMDVPDPTVYNKGDTVLVNGISFEVQGLPGMESNWSNGTQMLSSYDSLFGGQVLIRRVT